MLDKLPKDPAGEITTAGIKARPSSEEMKGAPCADNHRVDLHSKLQTVLTGIRRLTVRALGGVGGGWWGWQKSGSEKQLQPNRFFSPFGHRGRRTSVIRDR